MEVQPEDPQTWFERGVAFAELEDYKQAIACYDRALRLKSDFYEAWCELGVVLESLGRYEEANDCFNQALGAFCGNPTLLAVN